MRIIFSLILLLRSAFDLSLAFKLEFIYDGVFGGGFIRSVTGLILVIMNVNNIVKELKANRKESHEKSNVIDMIKVMLVTFLYILLFNILGALLSTLFFTIAILVFLNKGKWKINLIFSVVVTIFVFFMFVYFLNTHLPKGILENII